MNLQCYCFHKSGSMFFYRLFKKISKDHNFNYYSINNTPPNDKKWKESLINCILCPIRENVSNYNPRLKYIIHLRNPLDILISQYYSFGFTHSIPKNPTEKEKFIQRRKKIQSQTIDQYCLSDENIKEINEKYNNVLEWVEKYGKKENVFISHYDSMYYNFSKWLKDILSFLSLKSSYKKLLDTFQKEFENSSVKHEKTNITKNKDHHRSGLSRQYLVELKKETQQKVIQKFSPQIKANFHFL